VKGDYMNLVESVYKIAELFINESEMVSLDYENIEHIAQKMKKTEPPSFPILTVNNMFTGVLQELIAASINYCYWYGKSNIRPDGASSTSMYDLMSSIITDSGTKSIVGTKSFNHDKFLTALNEFGRALCINRFPLVEERIKHLNELKYYALDYCGEVLHYSDRTNDLDQNAMEYLLNRLVELFPGFASDMFLKRAFLFFIQLYRRFGWFKEELKSCPVPADYQVPKMLNHFGCIKYHSFLENMIKQDTLIPKHSKDECEIRSATILAMRELCKLTGWNVADVDAYFFLKRHQAKKKFHLTITTDY
jgi:hypothetical protein